MVQLTADLSESIPSCLYQNKFVIACICVEISLFCYYFFRMKLLRFPRKSVFVLRVFNVGVLLREGKQAQWLSVCLNALSETFHNSAVF